REGWSRRWASCADSSSPLRSPPIGGDLDPSIVEARALGDVGVVGGTERRDGLAVVAGAQPGALQRRDDPARHDVRHAQWQSNLAEIIPDADAHARLEAARAGVVGMPLEWRRLVTADTAEGRGDPPVR